MSQQAKWVAIGRNGSLIQMTYNEWDFFAWIAGAVYAANAHVRPHFREDACFLTKEIKEMRRK